MRLEHDEEALETRVVHEANGATWYRYLPNGSLQDITDPFGAQRQFLYDDDGKLKAEVDGGGGLWPVVRDGAGAIVGKRDPLGHFRPPNEDPSDPSEDPLAEEVPASTLAQEAGEALERSGFAVPRAGSLAMEVPVELRDALLPAESVGLEEEVRDAQGLLVRVERRFGDGSARAKRYGYDPNGNLRHFRDADGGDWHAEHASWNQRTSLKDPLGNVTRFGYSKRDRMVRVEDPLGTVTEYGWDLCDRLTAVRRHGKLRERYVFDAAGGLIEKRVPQVGPDGVSGSAGSAADGAPTSEEATLSPTSAARCGRCWRAARTRRSTVSGSTRSSRATVADTWSARRARQARCRSSTTHAVVDCSTRARTSMVASRCGTCTWERG